jgi:RNA polymerase subunit RPABC4/transcription elongation factor Spt4
MTLTKEDIELIKKFCQKYADSNMWECPICGAVDDCKDWCVMPLITKMSGTQIASGWHDAKTDPPKYYEHVLLLINIWYEVEGKKYDKEYMIEGYYHKDNDYCSWIGDNLESQETCVVWRELPKKEYKNG